MRAGAALWLGLLAAMPAAAQENGDLDRIPAMLENAPPPPAASNAHGKYYAEDAFTLSSLRGTLAVPVPPPSSSRWVNRTSLDAYDQWSLDKNLSFTFSDRFNLSEAEGIGFPGEAARNDLREAYFTWEPVTQTFVEAGRINLKSGIALGFNPTDFFKTRTGVAQASADPSSLREDRFGTAMLRVQTIWDDGSATFVYAPKLHTPRQIGGAAPGWIDPSFDQTNASDRFLLIVNFEAGNFSPQALAYHESGRTKLGLNLSYPIGQSVIAYGEWAGGSEPDLIAQAIAYGKATGTLPAFVPVLPPTSTSHAFRNDLAVGASWTSVTKVTLNLEYHFHQAGFSGGDWRNWFDTGAANPAAASELWYVRGFAAAMQQPMSRHQAFLRADWQDAFVTDLELSAISFVNLTDGSGMAQFAASYNLSDAWSVGAYVGGTFGCRRTEWGSLPGDASAIFQIDRYL
ncbi:MAG: hypothetical protein KGJ49_14335 [Alphaproteobacteria bacterium]|nr:hypothetical protein [Alphaproteobacteria bacterium]